MKLCIDCTYYQPGKERFLCSVPDECNHPNNMKVSPVDGKVVSGPDRPKYLRAPMGHCGPEAVWFKVAK